MVERSGQTGHIRDYSVEPHNSISASFRSGWRQRFQGTVEMRSLFRAFVFLSSPGAVALPSSRSRRRPDRKFMSGTITPLASIILSQTRDQLSMSSSIRSRVGAQCSHVSFINLKTSFGVPCVKKNDVGHQMETRMLVINSSSFRSQGLRRGGSQVHSFQVNFLRRIITFSCIVSD